MGHCALVRRTVKLCERIRLVRHSICLLVLWVPSIVKHLENFLFPFLVLVVGEDSVLFLFVYMV